MNEISFDQPLPLIEVDETNSFKLNKFTMEKLRGIAGYVSVISVCGLYRTGKSSMLNWLMGNKFCFKIGSTINRCTRGIWVYGETSETLLSNGQYGKVLVLDTEGIGSTSSDMNYDAKIFSLSLLICSTLVYNSMGSIDEATISSLSFMANLTKNIKVSYSILSESDELESFRTIFPSFVWVLRDFSLSLTDNGGSAITEDQYLASALQACRGYDRQTLERNRTRQMLSSFFPDRKCVALVRPVSDEETLQRAGELPLEQLRSEFQIGMSRLKDVIFGSLRPNSLHGRALTGSMYADLLESYVQAIEQGGVPTLQAAWEAVCIGECHAALTDGVSCYRSLLDPEKLGLPLDAVEVRSLHDKAMSAAIVVFDKRAAGEGRLEKRKMLETECERRWSLLEAANSTASHEQCVRLLSALFDLHMRDKLPQLSNAVATAVGESKTYEITEYGLDQRYAGDWMALLLQYDKEGRGPAKSSALSLFCAETVPSCTERLLSKAAALCSARLEDQQLRVEEAVREKAELLAETLVLREECARLASLLHTSSRNVVANEVAELEREMEELRLQKRAAERSAESERDQKERALSAVAALRQRVTVLEAKAEECEELKWVIMQKNDQLATMTGIFTPRQSRSGNSSADSRDNGSYS